MAVMAAGSRAVRGNVAHRRLSVGRGRKGVARAGPPVDTETSTVIPEPDYRIAATLLGGAGLLGAAHAYSAAVPMAILGTFLGVQTSRVRFKFDEKSLEVVIGEEEADSGENAFVGGQNKWAFDSFINWEFWWPEFPVLVYFKEKQTKPEGQIHFFPILFNGKELYNVMRERCGPTQNSGPKVEEE